MLFALLSGAGLAAGMDDIHVSEELLFDGRTMKEHYEEFLRRRRVEELFPEDVDDVDIDLDEQDDKDLQELTGEGSDEDDQVFDELVELEQTGEHEEKHRVVRVGLKETDSHDEEQEDEPAEPDAEPKSPKPRPSGRSALEKHTLKDLKKVIKKHAHHLKEVDCPKELLHDFFEFETEVAMPEFRKVTKKHCNEFYKSAAVIAMKEAHAKKGRKVTSTHGLTMLSAMTAEEINQLNGVDTTPEDSELRRMAWELTNRTDPNLPEVVFHDSTPEDNSTTLSHAERRRLRSSIDWEWALPRIKNQGRCGSCWAHGAIATVEGWNRIHCQQKYMPRSQETPALSEQHLVDCGLGGNGCNGGSPYWALVNTHGYRRASCYPYKARRGSCKTNCPVVAKVAKVDQWLWPNRDKIKHALQNGPMHASIMTKLYAYKTYKSGIIGVSLSHGQGSFQAFKVTHVVTIIGYGSEKGTPYWRLRQSYGRRWGERGHFRLKMDSNGGHSGLHWVGAPKKMECYPNCPTKKMNCKENCPGGWRFMWTSDHGCCKSFWSCFGNRQTCRKVDRNCA